MKNTSTNSSSRQRIGEAKSGERSALERFAFKYTTVIHNWLSNYNLQGFDADEICESVLLRVMVNLESYDEKRGSFREWLSAIARRAVSDFIREKKIATVDTSIVNQLDHLFAAPSHKEWIWESEMVLGMIHDETNSIFDTAREPFSEKQWRCFYEMQVAERTANEIGEDLGLTPSTVRKTQQRVLSKLRGIFGD